MAGFFGIALRNLTRNRVRTALTGGAVFVGAWMMFASLLLADGISEGIVDNLVSIESGAVLVTYDDTAPDQPETFVRLHRQVVSALSGLPGTVGIRQRMSFGGVLFGPSGNSVNLGLKGISPKQERPLIESLVVASGRFVEDGAAEVFVSDQVATRLGVAAGDQITLVVNTWGGQINALDLTVAGTFVSVAPWVDFTAFVPMSVAHDLYGADIANQYLIDLPSLAATSATIDAAVAALGKAPVVVSSYGQAGGFLLAIANANRYTFLAFNCLLYLVVAVGVANLLSIVVRERRSELGTLMAIGYTAGNILWLLLLEVVMLATVALLLAIAVAGGMYLFLASTGIPLEGAARNAFGGARLVPAFHPYQLGVVITVTLLITLAGALLPAMRAVRMDTSRILTRD